MKERLTKKVYHLYIGDNGAQSLEINKLGQLEDIEDEFGIDLIKILTAKEVYVFGTGVTKPYKLNKTNKIIKCDTFCFDFVNKTIHIHVPKVGSYWESFLDCGKTWSFTKEELK